MLTNHVSPIGVTHRGLMGPTLFDMFIDSMLTRLVDPTKFQGIAGMMVNFSKLEGWACLERLQFNRGSSEGSIFRF